MSTVSTRFAYKERRVGKITEIGLTRSSSTPSNPYGSRAEACQPETAVSAACQGHGNDPSLRTPASKTKGDCGSALRFFRNVPIREEEEFLSSSFYRGRWGGAWSPRPPSPRCRPVVMTMPCSTNSPEGLTCLSPTRSRAEGDGCQPCQPDFRDFSLSLLFIGKSY